MSMWIPRAIEPQLRQLAATRPVVVLTSAGQTGKTSTLRRLFPEHGFVALDLPSEAAQAEAEPVAFLQRHLARDVGIAPSTVNQWLSVLEASGQVVLLEPWFSNRTKSIVKSPKLYLADCGLLCALLNIRSEETLRMSPSVGAVWETFVLAQLRHRERLAGRARSLFFWRDRTREVDFVAEDAGRLELFEAKWTELPASADTVNLRFVREAMGKPKVKGAAVVCRAPHGFPLEDGCRALPVEELL